MATGTQTQILGMVEKVITDCKAEYMRDPEYANTGRVYAKDGLTVLTSFHYAFNNGYATVYFHDPKKGTSLQHNGELEVDTFHYLKYHEEARWETFLDQIKTKIGEARNA